ncbi:AAA family ATPase [Roseisolibacter agri]|uniref:AAA family ATPase n=1 Tax=Roseisolibacter agri TaxID=2014610 RepID=UPI0024E188D1|nr:AAA family ATPase [Roseisolibacter agri]
MPVDTDSRLDLLRVEPVPVLDHEPLWAPPVRAALEQLVRERQEAAALDAAGLTPTRTAVFSGPPGVGKTLAARWVARALGRPLLILDLAAVMSSYLGRTGANLRHVLDYAKGVRGVLLLDEIDALAKRRDDAQEIGELKRLVTVLLQEVDDWPPSGLLLAATNHPDLLDPAAWRRFDVRVEFPMPTTRQVHALVQRAAEAAGLASGALVDALALTFAGASFSDIERDLLRARRGAVVAGEPFARHAVRLVQEHAGALARADRQRLAGALRSSGLSQRQVNELTGVSRDTLRKLERTPTTPDAVSPSAPRPVRARGTDRPEGLAARGGTATAPPSLPPSAPASRPPRRSAVTRGAPRLP